MGVQDGQRLVDAQRRQIRDRLFLQGWGQHLGDQPPLAFGQFGIQVADGQRLQTQLTEEGVAEGAQIVHRQLSAGVEQALGRPLRTHQRFGQGAMALAEQRCLRGIAPFALQAIAHALEAGLVDVAMAQLLQGAAHHPVLTVAPAGKGQRDAAGVGVGLDIVAGQSRRIELLVETVVQPARQQVGQDGMSRVAAGRGILQAEAPLDLGRVEAGIRHVPELEARFLQQLRGSLVLLVEQGQVFGDERIRRWQGEPRQGLSGARLGLHFTPGGIEPG